MKNQNASPMFNVNLMSNINSMSSASNNIVEDLEIPEGVMSIEELDEYMDKINIQNKKLAQGLE